MTWLSRMTGIGSDVPMSASKIGNIGVLLLVGAGTWWLIPMAQGGWVPTDPIQNKKREQWRSLPNGTAQRVPDNGGAPNNQTGGATSAAAPASTPAPSQPGVVTAPPSYVAPASAAPVASTPQISGAQKFSLWAQAVTSLVQEIVPSATGGNSASSGAQSQPAPLAAPTLRQGTGRSLQSFAPRGYTQRPDNSRGLTAGPSSGRVPAPRPAPGSMFSGNRGGQAGATAAPYSRPMPAPQPMPGGMMSRPNGGYPRNFGGGGFGRGFARNFSGGGGRRH